MNYRKLGNSDLNVSTICLGTMTWGEQNTQEEAFEQMDFALDQGINFFDTAELYAVPPREETYGNTESIIGNWFKKTKKREKVILATKVAGPARNYLRKGKNSFVGKNLDDAINLKIIDEARESIDARIRSSSIIFICTPVSSVDNIIKVIANFSNKNQIISDVGSVKNIFSKETLALNGNKFNLVPGHPIAGTEHSGAKNAVTNLFRAKWCIITPLKKK